MQSRTIVLGYADTDGQTAPSVVCGPEVSPDKQWKVFSDANDLHVFPKGIKRLEILNCEPANVAIFISEKVAEEAKEAAEKRKQAEEKAAKERKAYLEKLKEGLPTSSGNKLFQNKPTPAPKTLDQSKKVPLGNGAK